MRSTARSTTLVAYLFDLGPDSMARIITHEPLTLTDLAPDQDHSATWKLQAAGYDLPQDHQLMLVLTSKDPLYSDASVDGSTTTISSPDGKAACLTLPLG